VESEAYFVLVGPISHCSVGSVITAHNDLTPVKRDVETHLPVHLYSPCNATEMV